MLNRAQPAALLVVLGVCALVAAGVALLMHLGNESAPLRVQPPAPQHSAVSVQPLDQSAEERAYEAIRKVPLAPEVKERAETTSPEIPSPTPSRLDPPTRADKAKQQEHLPPTTLALNCERLRKAYPPEELKKIPGFKEKCT